MKFYLGAVLFALAGPATAQSLNCAFQHMPPKPWIVRNDKLIGQGLSDLAATPSWIFQITKNDKDFLIAMTGPDAARAMEIVMIDKKTGKAALFHAGPNISLTDRIEGACQPR